MGVFFMRGGEHCACVCVCVLAVDVSEPCHEQPQRNPPRARTDWQGTRRIHGKTLRKHDMCIAELWSLRGFDSTV